LKKDTRLGKFNKKCDEGLLLGYSTTSKSYRVWNLTSGTLEEVYEVEFDETKGSQDENENLDDVRGIQLSKAMKNMDVGKLRPRQVNDDEDDQVQVLSNSNVQDDINQASSSGSHDNVQDQQVTSTSSQPNDQASASNQVPILQPTNIARDHPLDTIIGDIFRGVQTRLKLALFYEHFSFVLFIELEKIEEASRDVDWVNAMHEELNNFTRNDVWELVERPKNHNMIGTK
jgi:nicotinamide mononucleotide adenylyltransferase